MAFSVALKGFIAAFRSSPSFHQTSLTLAIRIIPYSVQTYHQRVNVYLQVGFHLPQLYFRSHDSTSYNLFFCFPDPLGECPNTHPWPYSNGFYCCSVYAVYVDAKTACPDSARIPCPELSANQTCEFKGKFSYRLKHKFKELSIILFYIFFAAKQMVATHSTITNIRKCFVWQPLPLNT